MIIKDDNWHGDITRVLDENCIHFDLSSPIWLDFQARSDQNQLKFLNFDLQFKQSVNISVSLLNGDLSYELKYIPGDFHLKRDGNVIYYGYESDLKEGQWKRFTRDLQLDIRKGLGAKKSFKSGAVITEVKFSGVGCLRNVSLSSREDLRLFFAAADWLTDNQVIN